MLRRDDAIDAYVTHEKTVKKQAEEQELRRQQHQRRRTIGKLGKTPAMKLSEEQVETLAEHGSMKEISEFFRADHVQVMLNYKDDSLVRERVSKE